MLVELENLDDVKVGDLLSDDISKKPYKVFKVSKNFILAFQNNFGRDYYTIYAKEPINQFIYCDNWHRYYQRTEEKYFYRGPDDLVFGGIGKNDDLDDYMNQLESGELEISLRRRVTLRKIYKSVRKTKND